MTDDTNKFIHEKIMGIPTTQYDGVYFCPDYTQWEHYGPMLEELCDDSDKWIQFMDWMHGKWAGVMYRFGDSAEPFGYWMTRWMFNPARGCQAIYEYFGGKK